MKIDYTQSVYTNYYYASTRAYLKTHALLYTEHIERLLSARDVAECVRVLEDTYLAPFLVDANMNVSNAVEAHVASVKHEIVSMAPEPRILDILWLKYDFINVRTIAKGIRAQLASEAILGLCFQTGTIPPGVLLDAYTAHTLRHLHDGFLCIQNIAESNGTAYEIDVAKNKAYFSALRTLQKSIKDPFVAKYIVVLIDLYNLKTALRIPRLNSGLKAENFFVPGGTFVPIELKTTDDACKRLMSYQQGQMKTAVEAYNECGGFEHIDRAMDEFQIEFLRKEAYALWSVAPLFVYFIASKNNAQRIRTIVSAKSNGIPEADLRALLRKKI